MLSSLLPVGVSHRPTFHPQSFNKVASTRAWPLTPVAGTLVVGTMNSMAVDVPHTMLSSLLPVGISYRRPLHPQRFMLLRRDGLLPVGVSHRRLLHPQSFITIASTRAWPSTSVAGTLVAGTMNSITVDVPHTMLSSLLPAGVSHRRPLHPQSCLLYTSPSPRD